MERDQLDEQEWQNALRYADVLRRMPQRPSAADVADAMAELAVSRATLFRWLKRYRAEERATALVSRKPGRRAGIDAFDPALKAIVDRNITTFYATPEKPTLTRLWKRISADCRVSELAPPSIRRLKGYLATFDTEAMTRRREGKARADAQFLALPGELSAHHPLQIVQIDHTKVDVTVVDPIERQPIGRPILTIAIDVYTRMVLGFYLSLEAPSVTSVALCLTHAIIDKTRWLQDRGISLDWPTSGLPECIHVDNGAEFHARAFKRGCDDHNILVSYRPPGTPRFGGHVERLIGTMMGAVHLLPGTHFSNVQDRGDYDPEARAVMTMRELEAWLALEIIAYHSDLHRGIGRPPGAAWHEAISGRPPRQVRDPLAFLIDFLPFEPRVLRRTGIHINNICYWSDSFAPWIGRCSDKVLVKFDPRDLHRVFVKLGGNYLMAPTRNPGRPAITLWEQKAALRVQRARGRQEIDEEAIFQTIAAQRALVEQATRDTTQARRLRARRAHLQARPALPASAPADEPVIALPHFPVEVWE
ncbi:Mu transposase C-terminal domain-containing protein [Ancylobacter sp. VNQ12]|uniref:Mu transposase C-terminal domain-containing protein n=1 Tax=Ancylobacter sp. VNQ12 TaxID=3400920 RepID=UPI003BFE3C09